MRIALIVAAVASAFALGACRREVPAEEPLKLGGPVMEQPAR